MGLADILGLAGVGLLLAAYAGGQSGRLDMRRPPALLMNLTGSLLILWSLLIFHFNLSAALIEVAWASIALFGLVRALMRR